MQDLTIVFDLDGTLVETAPDLIRATNHALGLAGLPPVDGAAIRPSISFGGRAMIVRGLELHGTRLMETEVDRLLEAFLEHYAANIAVESHAFPGLEAALDVIAARGARLAVCTNKREGMSRLLLETLGLADRFAAIAGRDTFAVHKPHPDHLTGAIRLAGGDPTRGMMIGDSDTGIRTARAAGLPVIAVPFGYTDVPMHDLGPDAVVAHYDHLVDTIDRLLSRER
ncbi:MAG: HAD family hydrolase [Hyphomicrobiaceae bacterium]|nr:HAD family hydrolase [Hyphomicrobiaceae bacterium]